MAEKTQKKIERKDVEKLASLARITIPENEIEKVCQDIEAILSYVSQINEANSAGGELPEKLPGNLSPERQYNFGVKNVMREDGQPHESGKFTDSLLTRAPKTEKGFIKVKKILQ